MAVEDSVAQDVEDISRDNLTFIDSDGDVMTSCVEHWELVSPKKKDSRPIRRVVVPGIYGVVHVDEGANTPYVVSMRGTRRPDELRAAAAVLLELAEAFEE